MATGFHALERSDRLLIARHGTAYFSQHLAAIDDAELDRPSALAGWTGKHLLAHVGYNAAALCRLLDWAASGVETPMYGSSDQRNAEIQDGAALNAGALRNLFAHNVGRLDTKWRQLPAQAWGSDVRTAQGRMVPAEETIWMRTREVWIHAVDLGNGARFGDFPDVVLQSLLDDIVGSWRRKGDGAGLHLQVDQRSTCPVIEDGRPTTTVRGPLAAVVRWAAGRGSLDLDEGGDAVPPHWL
jgi:maleylpyruvate isomerase